jgi:hypothetical protein
MTLKHDGYEIRIDLSRPSAEQVMALALLPHQTLAEFGSTPEEATRKLLQRISALMLDAGRPMLTIREITLVLDQVLRPA